MLKSQKRQLLALSAVATAFTGVLLAHVSVKAQPGPMALSNLAIFSDAHASDAAKLEALRGDLQQIVNQNESQYIITSVQVKDLQTGQVLYDHGSGVAQYAASLNKIPLAWLLLQDLRSGAVTMSQQLSWNSSDIISGYGVYDQPNVPPTATVQQLIQDMLNMSGNTATVILGNQVLGGPLAINARLAQYPQLVQTSLQGVRSSSGNEGFYLGNTTPREGSWLMEQLQKNKDGYEQFMQHALATNIFTTYGVRSQLSGDPNIELANKVGIIDDSDAGSNRHDEGIIYNIQTHRAYEYSFMTTNFSTDLSSNVPAEQSLADMGLVVLRFAGERSQANIAKQVPTAQPTFHESLPLNKKALY